MLVVSPTIASVYELQDVETDSERNANVYTVCMAIYDGG